MDNMNRTYAHPVSETVRQMMADWNAATPAQRISARITAAVAAGTDPIDALKQVCGAANVDAMIANLYAELRSR